jgi:V8-like Glu-specific endopeptidase
MKRPRVWLAALACLILPLASPEASDVSRGIGGRDDRVLVDSWEPPWPAIGRVNVAGEAFCTGVLIAPDKVATAAHCLVWPGSGQLRRLDDIHFVAARRRDAHLGHSRARAVRLHPRFDLADSARLEMSFADIAVIELRDPLEVAPLAPLLLEPEGRRFNYAFYSKDRRYLPSLHAGCRFLKKLEGIWLVDCDTVEGGSGGPLLFGEGAEARPAALVIGYRVVEGEPASIAVPIGGLTALGLEIKNLK